MKHFFYIARKITSLPAVPGVAVAIGIASILLGLLLGIAAYRDSCRKIEKTYLVQYMRIARDLVFHAEMTGYTRRDGGGWIGRVLERWNSPGSRPADETLFIVDGSGRYLYHSGDPSLSGSHMASQTITRIDGKVSMRSEDLIRAGLEFAGYCTHRDGREYISIMVPVPLHHACLALHRDRESFIREATSNIIAVLWLIVAITSSVVIFCFALLFHAYRRRRDMHLLSEERYRRVVEDQTESILRWRPDGTVTFSNEVFRRFRGCAEKEGAGGNVFSIVGTDEAESLGERVRSLTPESPITVNEQAVPLPGGNVRWEQWVHRGFFDGRGGLVDIQSVGRDITERKNAEAALMQSEASYRFLAENTGGLTFIIDMDLNNRYLSSNAGSIIGFTPEERNNRPILERLTPECRRIVEELFREEILRERDDPAADPRRTVPLELHYIHKDGSLKVLDTVMRFIRNKDGALEGIYGVSHDVTERRRAEMNREAALEALKESESKYRFLVEYMGDIAFITGLDMETRFVTPSIESILGFTPEERVMQAVESQLTPASFLKARETLARELIRDDHEGADPQRSVMLELDFYHKDGSIRTLETVFKGIRDGSGVITALYGISRDITDRKETEEWLRNSLEEKDILLKEIHHRVKNNMQIISSLLDLQKNRMGDKQGIEMLDMCQKRIRTMALVHEKLYRSGNFSAVNFKEYLEDIISENTSLFSPGRNIDFRVESEDLFVSIGTAIPCALVVNELVTNSLKHAFAGKERGSVSVRLHGKGNGEYMLTVQDDGVGFSKPVKEAHSSSLGLQLVQGLVKQLGGTISFETGAGTAVTVVFTA